MRHFARTRARKRVTCITGSLYKPLIAARIIVLFLAVNIATSCSLDSTPIRLSPDDRQSAISPANVDDLLLVDCLLPGQIRRLDQSVTYAGPRRPVKTTSVDCAIRGDEYVSYDRSNYKTTHMVWLAAVETSDKEAQSYLGEIYDRGLDTVPDYSKAATWYERSAKQGHAPAIKQLDFGSYHALVIGNNNYKNLDELLTARSDAEIVSEILETKYGFKVTSLCDASRYQILTELNRLRETLTENDNLLINYAGHGNLDKVNKRGHWLPVDAEHDSDAKWVSNVSLTGIFNILSARHILAVADSCYSGSLTHSTQTQLRPGHIDETWAIYYKTAPKMRSRTALSSDGVKPVLDEGNMRHSAFDNAFIDSLRSNQGVIEGQRLIISIAAQVTNATYDRIFEQWPEYGPINLGGHEAEDFILAQKS